MIIKAKRDRAFAKCYQSTFGMREKQVMIIHNWTIWTTYCVEASNLQLHYSDFGIKEREIGNKRQKIEKEKR